MCSHQHLKHRYREDRLRKHLLEKAPYLPEGSLDLLEKMLRLDPTKRISAEEAFRVSGLIQGDTQTANCSPVFAVPYLRWPASQAAKA